MNVPMWKFTEITISHADQYHVYFTGRKRIMLLTLDVPLWVESLPYMQVITDSASILVLKTHHCLRKGLMAITMAITCHVLLLWKHLNLVITILQKQATLQPPVSLWGSHRWQKPLLYGSVIRGIAMYLSCDMVLGEIAKNGIIQTYNTIHYAA